MACNVGGATYQPFLQRVCVFKKVCASVDVSESKPNFHRPVKRTCVTSRSISTHRFLVYFV